VRASNGNRLFARSDIDALKRCWAAQEQPTGDHRWPALTSRRRWRVSWPRRSSRTSGARTSGPRTMGRPH